MHGEPPFQSQDCRWESEANGVSCRPASRWHEGKGTPGGDPDQTGWSRPTKRARRRYLSEIPGDPAAYTRSGRPGKRRNRKTSGAPRGSWGQALPEKMRVGASVSVCQGGAWSFLPWTITDLPNAVRVLRKVQSTRSVHWSACPYRCAFTISILPCPGVALYSPRGKEVTPHPAVSGGVESDYQNRLAELNRTLRHQQRLSRQARDLAQNQRCRHNQTPGCRCGVRISASRTAKKARRLAPGPRACAGIRAMPLAPAASPRSASRSASC